LEKRQASFVFCFSLLHGLCAITLSQALRTPLELDRRMCGLMQAA